VIQEYLKKEEKLLSRKRKQIGQRQSETGFKLFQKIHLSP